MYFNTDLRLSYWLLNEHASGIINAMAGLVDMGSYRENEFRVCLAEIIPFLAFVAKSKDILFELSQVKVVFFFTMRFIFF